MWSKAEVHVVYLSVNVFRIERLFLYACSYDYQKSSGGGGGFCHVLGSGSGGEDGCG